MIKKYLNLRFISRYKKVILYILGYFIIGYIIILGLYLLSNPGYFRQCPLTVAQFKCSNPIDLVIDLMNGSDFWIEVLVWPLTLITFLGSGS